MCYEQCRKTDKKLRVLARAQIRVRLSIRRQPASEMERSGIELRHCSYAELGYCKD
ncbi:MAG: hypothetical protein J1F42_00565 [Lachnospiraceae bacterium]|nr:hypothetical protein [Lachnospiraceae bacterium]